ASRFGFLFDQFVALHHHERQKADAVLLRDLDLRRFASGGSGQRCQQQKSDDVLYETHFSSGLMYSIGIQCCIPHFLTVRCSIERKIKFSTASPIKMTVKSPANTLGISS